MYKQKYILAVDCFGHLDICSVLALRVAFVYEFMVYNLTYSFAILGTPRHALSLSLFLDSQGLSSHAFAIVLVT